MISARSGIWRTAAMLGLAVWLGGCTPGDADQSSGRTESLNVGEAGQYQTGESSTTIASPEAYRGAGLARQVCAQCHDVTDGSDRSVVGNAPTFRSVANRPGMTADALEDWLRSTHPTMPNYKFGATETEELVAYIMGLTAH